MLPFLFRFNIRVMLYPNYLHDSSSRLVRTREGYFSWLGLCEFAIYLLLAVYVFFAYF
jgi:hypothetical protein